MVEMKKVEGRDCGQRVVLFALSTCIWCKKTKKLLEELEIEYEFVFVDLLEGDERKEAVEMLQKHNPRRSFPTLCVGDDVIVGYKKDEIEEALK